MRYVSNVSGAKKGITLRVSYRQKKGTRNCGFGLLVQTWRRCQVMRAFKPLSIMSRLLSSTFPSRRCRLIWIIRPIDEIGKTRTFGLRGHLYTC